MISELVVVKGGPFAQFTEARRGQGLMHVAMHIANTFTYYKEYLIILNHEIII